MKTQLLLAGFIFTFFLSSSQPTINVSPPISVTNYSTDYGKHLPRLEILEDGTIIVFWSKSGSNSGIFMARKDNDIFGDVIEVPTGDIQPDIWGGGLGPAIAVYGNTLFIVFEVWGEDIYCVRSTDGGLSFDPPVVAFTPPSGRAATLPTISTSNSGNPIIGFITTNLSEQDALYEIVISEDSGLSFLPAVVANDGADGLEVCECCPSNIIMSEEGDIYVSFRNNNSNVRDIWVSRSTDEGLTFPIATDVDPTNWVIQGCPSTGPQSIEMDNLLLNVFYSAGSDWENGVYISALDKSTFELTETNKLPAINEFPANQNFPRISGSEDTLGIVWHEHTGQFYNVAFSWSFSGMEGITEQAINLTNASNPQTYPDIRNFDNQFHVVYEDQATATLLYHTVDFESTTAIPANDKTPLQMTVFPNPATTHFQISHLTPTQKMNIEIINLMGKVVHSGSTENGVMDVGRLSRGIYMIRAYNDKMEYLEKILLQ